MQTSVVDFAFSRPAPSAIKASGYAGVIRYLCADPAKAIDPAEAAGYLAAGLSIALVYEDGAADANGGAAVGAEKAAIARPELAALRVPAGRPVYFAVDEELSADVYPSAWACVETFSRTLGRPAGVYGPRPLLAYCAAHGARYLWETGASSWNTGPEPPDVQLHQLATQVVVDGATVDVDVTSVADWGQWPVRSPSPPPVTGQHLELNVAIHTVSIPTDSNGDGFAETTIPWSQYVAVAHEGTRDAAHFAAGEAHVADVGGHIAVSVTGAVREGVAVVLVTALG
jgi:hypothetical protein